MDYDVGEGYDAFLSHVRRIQVDRHIVRGRRGSEENVKTKIVVPLLLALGWDLLDDIDFERRGADIVLHSQDAAEIVVEVKAWGEEITAHLDQCLEYSLKLDTPWVVVSSGEYTALYCSLLDTADLLATQPLYQLSFQSLRSDRGKDALREMATLVGKEAFAAGHTQLSARVAERLEATGLTKAREGFRQEASSFEAETKSRRLTVSDFRELAEQHREEVRNSLVMVYEGIVKLAKLDEKIRVRYRSRSIGLEYRLTGRPRTKTLGLVGIYPDQAKIGFGLENWRRLKTPETLYEELAEYPREVRSRQWADGLLRLLTRALREIV